MFDWFADTVKSRIQTAAKGESTAFGTVFMKIFHEEGFAGLYRVRNGKERKGKERKGKGRGK
jgi:hypothetical protein